MRRPGLAKKFAVDAPHTSPTRKFVAAAFLNGQLLDRPYLRWAEIARGGATLRLELTEQRNRWTNVRPPSTSSQLTQNR